MGMLKEFRDFAMRGNVVDMAVGIIIGGAFGKIITSMVNDVIMPPIGMALGKVDFKNLFLPLRGEYPTLEDAKAAGAPTINYGLFINTVLDFVIVAFCIFLVIRGLNRLKKKEAPPPAPDTRACPQCLSTIPKKARRCSQCTAEVQPAA